MMNMQELQALVELWQSRVTALGFTLGTFKGLRVSRRMTRTLGRCDKTIWRNKRTGEVTRVSYNLVFSAGLLAMPEADISNTVAHEVCHAVMGSMGHDEVWRAAGDAVGRAYGVHISVYCEGEEGERWRDACKKVLHRYMVVCRDCGRRWYFPRANKLVKDLKADAASTYKCPCGSHGSLDLYTKKGNDWRPFENVERVPF